MVLSLHELIPQVLAKQTDWRIMLARQWSEVVGALDTRIRLEKIYDDTLVIGVYESHWMQELYLLSSVLQDSINDAIGEHRINHLRFKLVEDRKRPERKPPPKKIKRPKNVELSARQTQALAGIKDKELCAALTDFWGRCTVFAKS